MHHALVGKKKKKKENVFKQFVQLTSSQKCKKSVPFFFFFLMFCCALFSIRSRIIGYRNVYIILVFCYDPYSLSAVRRRVMKCTFIQI